MSLEEFMSRPLCLRSLLFVVIAAFACASAMRAEAQTASVHRVRVAVLDFGESATGRRVSETLASALASSPASGESEKAETKINVLDRDLASVAARGSGYTGLLNLSLQDARNLGAAIGCDFFIAGEAQTLRRAPAAAPAYHEAYASIFIVSARTGRLVAWERPSFEAATPEQADAALVSELSKRARTSYAATILEAQSKEATERRAQLEQATDVVTFEDLSKDEEASPEESRMRAPQPYRRLRPVYTNEAARAEIEATVDVLVDIDAEGEVSRVEVARWAGYGLDESVLSIVRRLHFRPAMREGSPVPVRVLLRYNFRRPPKTDRQAQQDKR